MAPFSHNKHHASVAPKNCIHIILTQIQYHHFITRFTTILSLYLKTHFMYLKFLGTSLIYPSTARKPVAMTFIFLLAYSTLDTSQRCIFTYLLFSYTGKSKTPNASNFSSINETWSSHFLLGFCSQP